MKILSVATLGMFPTGSNNITLEPPPLRAFPHLHKGRFRFLDRSTKIAIYLADQAIQKAELPPAEVAEMAICLGIDQATFVSNQDHWTRLEKQTPLSPALFTATLPNIPGAMVSITQQIFGAEYTFSSGCFNLLHALEKASYLLSLNPNQTVLCGTICCSLPAWDIKGQELGIMFLLQSSQKGNGSKEEDDDDNDNKLTLFSSSDKNHWEKENYLADPFYFNRSDSLPDLSGESGFALLFNHILQASIGSYTIGMKQNNWFSWVELSCKKPIPKINCIECNK